MSIQRHSSTITMFLSFTHSGVFVFFCFFFLIFFFFFNFFLDNSFFPHITTVETVFTYPQSNEPKHSQNKVAELNIYARACMRVCVCLNLSCMQTFWWIKCNRFFDGFQKLQAMDNGTVFLKILGHIFAMTIIQFIFSVWSFQHWSVLRRIEYQWQLSVLEH